MKNCSFSLMVIIKEPLAMGSEVLVFYGLEVYTTGRKTL
jgi:hypothetical protein